MPTDEDGDKRSRGTVLVVGGSPMTPGAVLLAGIGALRMGAGRLQLATVAPASVALAIAVPEALVIPMPVDDHGEPAVKRSVEVLGEHIAAAQAVLIGPGLQRTKASRRLLACMLGMIGPTTIVVLDAVALGALRETSRSAVAALRNRLILTPNREELEELLADTPGRADDARAAARRWGAVVTSFGDVASCDGRRWTAGRATPGLGTSGSGDVLAGLAAGAAARCGDAAQAACWATFVHGEAGNRLSERLGRLGFIARELLDDAPLVIAELERHAPIV